MRSFLRLLLIPNLMVMNFGISSTASAVTPVRKPLQFVLLAFDGSEMMPRWEDTRQFAKNNNLHFTYFVSGVLFIGRDNPSGSTKPGDEIMAYQGPHKQPGQSDIGFSAFQQGNSNTNQPIIVQRVKEMNAALSEGNELGSHLNGHFDASQWSASDWQQEFTDFNNLLFSPTYKGTHGNANIDRSSYITPSTFLYKLSDIVGFRTPYLAQNANLYPVMQKAGYTYDTSKTSQPNYWPEKKFYDPQNSKNGIWNFPLAELVMANAKPWEQTRTLSMDYNFYVSQQNGNARRGDPVDDPTNQAFFQDQMLNTYRAYFKSNYDGNRAPIHIGHHFALWNGGIYWNAMQQFASEVCKLKDVRCITYKELVKFMETLTPQEMDAYRAGAFTADPPALTKVTIPSKKQDKRSVAGISNELQTLKDKLSQVGEQEAGQIRSFVQRWEPFALKAEDEVNRITRAELNWLREEEKPIKLLIQGYDKTYEELVKENLAPGPSKAHSCEGGDCQGDQ